MILLSKMAITFCIALISQNLPAQVWVRVAQLPQSEFTALEIIDGTLYAASGENIYTSTDNGATWKHSLLTGQKDIWVNCFIKFSDKIYAGTSRGIFSTGVDDGTFVWNHDLKTDNITSFAERNDELYASLEVRGILKLSGAAWMSFSSGLPSYSMSVTKILNTPADLLAIAGANGTFYRYNFKQNVWVEEYFSNTGVIPGMHFDDLVPAGNRLYASRYNTVYRSDDGGENWREDKLGLTPGQSRTMYATADSIYSITMIGKKTTVLDKRDITTTDTNWAGESVMLPFLTYMMRERNGTFFIASDNGIFRNDTTLGVPIIIKEITIYPNPSNGHFAIQSSTPIDDITIYDSLGRLVLSEKGNYPTEGFNLTKSGLYFVQMTTGSSKYTEKIIIN